MVMATGNPEWSIKIPDGRRIDAKSGNLLVGVGALSTTADEEAAFALAERTAARWGIPGVEPKRSLCASCAYFVALDGEGHLLDYGCCAAEAGPFDGQVVARSSGCPSFTDYEET